MKMFRERNPVPLGLIVVSWLVAAVLLVLNINTLVGMFGREYHAEIAEAAGLKQGDPVRVSGLDVGRVSAVELGDRGVLVTFRVNERDIELGDQTSASVGVETVLGDKALVLRSKGFRTTGEWRDDPAGTHNRAVRRDRRAIHSDHGDGSDRRGRGLEGARLCFGDP